MNHPDDEYEMMMTTALVIVALVLCGLVTLVFLKSEPYLRG